MIKSKEIHKIALANPGKAIATHKDLTTLAQFY